MKIVIGQVFLLIVYAVIGYLLCRFKITDSKHADLLSGLEVYLFLPATIFKTFSSNFTIDYIKQNYLLLVLSAIILIIIALVAIPVSNILTKDKYQKNIYRYSLTVPNYGYMGYALAGGIFGSSVLLSVMIFALPISIFTYTVGFCMLTKSRLSFKKIFNPVIFSMLLGMVVGLFEVKMPSFFGTFISNSAACMAPISMLLGGMVISDFSIKSLLNKKASYIVTAIRLIVIPCILAGVLKLLTLDFAVIPALMIYAMPCGLNTIVFPKLINENCETGASLALISSISSCISIPICLYLFA